MNTLGSINRQKCRNGAVFVVDTAIQPRRILETSIYHFTIMPI